MARPSKSVKVMSKNLTKEEKDVRLETENNLKGKADKINPPKYLNKTQKKIFNYIVSELKESGILGNLDIYILAQCCVSIDRLQYIDDLMNDNRELGFSKNLVSTRDKYLKEFFRCANELSLSPQSRAKLGNINLQAEQERQDPLLKVLSGGK
jgi:P27 family predicted phage terminase small subunit